MYKKFIYGEKKTCANVYRIGIGVHGQSSDRCEQRCGEDTRCKFYFYTTNNWCGLYSSCDQYRVPRAMGTTFKKSVDVRGVFFGIYFQRQFS